MSENSSVTSIDDDNTENFVENPTRELLAEGFLGFFSPIVENLDSKVKQTQWDENFWEPLSTFVDFCLKLFSNSSLIILQFILDSLSST